MNKKYVDKNKISVNGTIECELSSKDKNNRVKKPYKIL